MRERGSEREREINKETEINDRYRESRCKTVRVRERERRHNKIEIDKERGKSTDQEGNLYNVLSELIHGKTLFLEK